MSAAKPKSRKSQAAAPRVLIVCHNHPAFFPGGTEILAHGLFREWQHNGEVDARFLAATGAKNGAAHPGTAFQSLPGASNEFLFWSDRFDYFQQSQAVPSYLYTDFAEFLRREQPQIVHFHHTLRLGLEALKVVRLTLPDARIVYTLHDFIPICHRDGQMVRAVNEELCSQATPARCHQCFPERSVQQFKTREMWIRTHLDLVDQFLSPSDFLAQRYTEWGIPKQKIRVMRNGIAAQSPAPARKLEAGGSRNRFAYFGQWSPYKGLPLLLDAMEQLCKRGIPAELEVHGSGQFQPQGFIESLEARLAAFGSQVTVRGRYRTEDIPHLMQTADWVVVPSTWWENAPLVIDEALQHRRPVICSNIGGMAEKIRNGVNGLHFQAGNAASLAEIMATALEQPKLWSRLASRIEPPPTISQCAEAHIRLYRSLL